MLNHEVQPKILFHLLHNMSELWGDDALDRRVVAAEGKEEVDDALADSNLFALFVDVLVGREEEKNLCVGVVLVLGLSHGGL